MKPAIVLLSGGIDSATTMAVAKNEGFEVYALSFDYGQKHGIELESACQNAARLNIKKHLIMNFDLKLFGGSALTSDIEVPKDRAQSTLQTTGGQAEHRTQTINSESLGSGLWALGSEIPVTYVPARNTIFLSFALAWAETVNSADIFIGANAIDYSGYPDCRPEFIKAFEDMANLATKASVEGSIKFRIHTPLITLTKAEIIRKGSELGVDFSLTWSCYDPQKRQNTEPRTQNTDKDSLGSEIYVPCMQCDSCLLRAKGFKEAGIKDPLSSWTQTST